MNQNLKDLLPVSYTHLDVYKRQDLFRDSLSYFPAAGFEITWQTFDLHADEPAWNLRTEHEGMFSEQGIPIKALIARKGPDSTVTWVEPKELARRLDGEDEE